MTGRPKIKAVRLFISYSHSDKRYRDRLLKHLSPLRDTGYISTWYDGEIVAGEGWESEIIKNLNRAEIVLLLVTADFLASDFCKKELTVALGRHKARAAIVIPVIVRDVDWEILRVSKIQALPEDGKPITDWRRQESGWKSVAAGVRRTIEYLNKPRPVDDALGGVEGIAAAADAFIETQQSTRATNRSEFPSISAFWQARSSTLRDTDTAVVSGTFSQFAPMMIGPPKAKRFLHREFRRAIERSRAFGDRKRTAINACLSISAGQMVQRSMRSDADTLYFGLYNSIVRNSIPVFVTREYYETRLKQTFAVAKRRTFEAKVEGKVFPLDNSYIRHYVKRHRLERIVSTFVIEDLCKDVYGLLVDGRNSEIHYQGPARYLDGDIWLAVESGGQERFVTTFLDVGDPQEREEELRRLFDELRRSPERSRVIAQYDDLSEFVSRGYNLATTNKLLEDLFRFGFGA